MTTAVPTKAGQGSANDCLRSMACKMQVDFHPEAVAELEESADWYGQRSPNAAHDLLVAVDMAIAKIAHQLVSNSDLVRAVMCFAAFVSDFARMYCGQLPVGTGVLLMREVLSQCRSTTRDAALFVHQGRFDCSHQLRACRSRSRMVAFCGDGGLLRYLPRSWRCGCCSGLGLSRNTDHLAGVFFVIFLAALLLLSRRSVYRST